jgi:hypothetical protein
MRPDDPCAAGKYLRVNCDNGEAPSAITFRSTYIRGSLLLSRTRRIPRSAPSYSSTEPGQRPCWAATCAQARLLVVAERYGHSGSQAARRRTLARQNGRSGAAQTAYRLIGTWRQIGVYRATAATSNRYAARLASQGVSVLIADYFAPRIELLRGSWARRSPGSGRTRSVAGSPYEWGACMLRCALPGIFQALGSDCPGGGARR